MHSNHPRLSGPDGGSDVSGGPSSGGSGGAFGSTSGPSGSVGRSGGGSIRHSSTIPVIGVPLGPSFAVKSKLASLLEVRPPPGAGPTGPDSMIVSGASRSGPATAGASSGG